MRGFWLKTMRFVALRLYIDVFVCVYFVAKGTPSGNAMLCTVKTK